MKPIEFRIQPFIDRIIRGRDQRRYHERRQHLQNQLGEQRYSAQHQGKRDAGKQERILEPVVWTRDGNISAPRTHPAKSIGRRQTLHHLTLSASIELNSRRPFRAFFLVDNNFMTAGLLHVIPFRINRTFPRLAAARRHPSEDRGQLRKTRLMYETVFIICQPTWYLRHKRVVRARIGQVDVSEILAILRFIKSRISRYERPYARLPPKYVRRGRDRKKLVRTIEDGFIGIDVIESPRQRRTCTNPEDRFPALKRSAHDADEREPDQDRRRIKPPGRDRYAGGHARRGGKQQGRGNRRIVNLIWSRDQA